MLYRLLFPSPQPAPAILVWIYAILAVINAVAAVRTGIRWRRDAARPRLFLVPAAFGLYSLVAAVVLGRWLFTGELPSIPKVARDFIDSSLNPATVCLIWWGLLFVLLVFRRPLVSRMARPHVFNLPAIAFLVALTDNTFASLVSQPDHFAILLMVAATLFYLYAALSLAVRNDQHIACGQPPVEGQHREREKVLVWPDLVYIELLAMIIVTTLLLTWSLSMSAPLEQPANPLHTPNPAKAPWYFVGLQELLVYFDPWLAGVVIPSILTFGLMILPYLDHCPGGSGYYSFATRPRTTAAFLFGFLGLWLLLIVIGVFFRGPNWAFYGPFEPRELPKVEVTAPRPLSSCVSGLIGVSSPRPGDAAVPPSAFQVLSREWPGLGLLLAYFVILPLALQRGPTHAFRRRVGTVRYYLAMFLFLFMLMIPLKILLREIFYVNYLVYIPEWGWSI